MRRQVAGNTQDHQKISTLYLGVFMFFSFVFEKNILAPAPVHFPEVCFSDFQDFLMDSMGVGALIVAKRALFKGLLKGRFFGPIDDAEFVVVIGWSGYHCYHSKKTSLIRWLDFSLAEPPLQGWDSTTSSC